MILLTNDDGVEAPGLAHLAEILAGEYEIMVVAPEENCSGAGHSITINQPIRVRRVGPGPGGCERLSVAGTPADAVKFACKQHCRQLPDLIVSGINAGPNVGVNVFYSGTVGAAFEALVQGIPAVAVSSSGWDAPFYETAAHYARRVVDLALRLAAERDGGEPLFCLNLNVPARPLAQVRGLRVTRHGTSGFDESFTPAAGAGEDHWVIDGVMRVHDPDEGFCAAALEAGFATLTPLRMDLTDEGLLARLRAESLEADGGG